LQECQHVYVYPVQLLGLIQHGTQPVYDLLHVSDLLGERPTLKID
jgi:hypothetical protein